MIAVISWVKGRERAREGEGGGGREGGREGGEGRIISYSFNNLQLQVLTAETLYPLAASNLLVCSFKHTREGGGTGGG